MKTTRFEVLSQADVERIHADSMEILIEVDIKGALQPLAFRLIKKIFRVDQIQKN